MTVRQGILFLLLLICPLLCLAQPIKVTQLSDEAITREWMQLIEHQSPYTSALAYQAYQDGNFSPHGKGIPSLGIGTPPIWLAIELENNSDTLASLLFELANGWQDDISLFRIGPNGEHQQWHGGDARVNHSGNRFFRAPLELSPGIHLLLLRVSGPDPRVLPVYITPWHDAEKRDRNWAYSYGFLYGGIFALLGYNFLLYLGIGSRSYLYYSLFLLTFLSLNVSYTGHGSSLIWHNLDHWRQWSNPLLMTLYCITGLMFAIRFLGVDKLRPHLSQTVLGLALLMIVTQGVAFALEDRELALILAFDFVYIFTLLMPVLGVMAWRTGLPTAKLFLLASISTMVGIGTTTFTVDGVLPFNQWTYRAAEIGMLIDAVLLALALAAKFRRAEKERVLAQQLASTDPLTGIDNRRAFTKRLQSHWDDIGQNRCQALIMVDIDKFKSINDTLGHDAGDKVLMEIARTVRYSIRNRDHCGRWGGEEFVVHLPSATEAEIHAVAERLRHNIADLSFPEISDKLRVTASIGVCLDQGFSEHEDILRRADEAMYAAKEAGGNRIKFA